jgi:hypothetical protein
MLRLPVTTIRQTVQYMDMTCSVSRMGASIVYVNNMGSLTVSGVPRGV